MPERKYINADSQSSTRDNKSSKLGKATEKFLEAKKKYSTEVI